MAQRQAATDQQVEAPAATQPAPYDFLNVTVGQTLLLHDQTPTDIPTLQKLLASMPPEQRRRTVLAVRAAAGDVTVERFFSAVAQLSQLVREYELAYLSQIGIAPATQPAATSPAAQIDDEELVKRISVVDPTLRELRKTLDAMEFNVARLRRQYGDRHRSVNDANSDIELQKQRFADYVAEYLQYHPLPPPQIVKNWVTVAMAAQADPVLQQLMSERSRLSEQLKEKSSTLGAEHPAIVSLNRRLTETDQLISMQTRRFYEEGLSIERIAKMDPHMATLLLEQQKLELQLQQEVAASGGENARARAIQAELEAQRKRIEEFAQTFRRRYAPTTQP